MRGSTHPVGFFSRDPIRTRAASVLLIAVLILSMMPMLLASAHTRLFVPAITARLNDGSTPDSMKYIQVNDLMFDAVLLRATYAGLTAEVAATGLPGTLFNISISPSELRLEPEATAAITAVGYDSYGNELPDTIFTWTTTVGNLLPTGNWSQMMLQAGLSVGTGIVTVTSGGISATAQVVVVPGPVASLVISPAVLVLDTGAFMDLEARAYDAFGNFVPNAIFEWSDTGEGDWTLSLTSNSLASFYSGTSGGNAVITVTLGSKVVTLVITINPEPVKQTDLAMVYAFGATSVVLACIVVVLLWMLFRRRPGMAAPSPEAKGGSQGPDAHE